MSIEAWVTTPGEVYLAHLERSEESPFRGFAVSRMRGADPGTGSLEHHLDNDLTRDGTLLADGNLVWMRYRGRTLVWIIEERAAVLDESEHASDWVRVTGRGVKQLIGDRIVWPKAFSESNLNPATWGAGDWKTTLDGSAASGQKVVPVTSTVGAIIGDPVQLTGGGNSELGVIESIVVGVSVTLEGDLAHTYASGARIASVAKQWRRFINRPAGEMLWDLIAESNPRFATQLTRGTIETDFDDGWTQDLRFDNVLDVVADVVAAFGDIDMNGLQVSYYRDPGDDRSELVIFEEGADLRRIERTTSDRDTVTWVVAEGVGEGVTAKLAVAKDVTATRRREAYVDAKDAGNIPLVQRRANAAIAELKKADSLALEVTEERFAALVDYDLWDTIRVIAPSRGIDAIAVIVAIYLAEDEALGVRVGIDVNTPRQEALLRLEEGNRSVRRSVATRNRQPQGQLVPFSFSGADVFDDTDTMDVFLAVPDRMYVTLEVSARIRFRQYFAAAKAASSGGGSTSGASSASSSGSNTAHVIDGGTGSHSHGGGPAASSHPFGSVQAVNDHTHAIGHTHSTPNHTHGLDYGVFKESYPGSHSVTLKVYELEGGSWTLRATVPGLTDDFETIDLVSWITGPGDWRLELKSDASQPNGGRLGCDVYGYVLGAIQSE